jgi:chromate transporter
MDVRPDRADRKRGAPTSGEIFLGFLLLGLTGFGGVLPQARRMIVDDRHWLTGAEFIDLLGLCQFLPGGNIINIAVVLGLRFRGAVGVFAALFGLMAAPTASVIGLGFIYDRFQDDVLVRRLFVGLSAAAAGLLISLAVKVLLPIIRKPVSLIVAALCFCAVALLRTPLLPTMAVLTPLSVFAVWRLER